MFAWGMLCGSLETVVPVFAAAVEPVLSQQRLWSIGYGVEYDSVGEIGFVGTEEAAADEFVGYPCHLFLAGELACEEQGCGCCVVVYTVYVVYLCFSVF